LALEPPDRSKKTSSGKFSTSADVLEAMRGSHQIVDIILEYRELSKLQSTYVDALPSQVNPKTGRVHTTFNQTGTVTGRLASQNPNLQNIPTRTEIGRKVRQGFIAAPGTKLLAVDYSQVELRIVAHLAQDKAMMNAFSEGQDIHAATAAAIEDVPLEEVTKQQRRHAKAINFGLIYGMSPYGLTRTTDLTLAEAENFVKEYFREFPGVKAWLDKTRLDATRKGYVETLLGRKRYFPALAAGTNYMVRQREEREAINAPVQGTAADIIKLAMIRLPDALEKEGLKTRMILQVHDELIFEVPEEELEQAMRVVTQEMENAFELSVPLVTEARVGSNWGELTVVDSDLTMPLDL
jgi:DNA polymerase-1